MLVDHHVALASERGTQTSWGGGHTCQQVNHAAPATSLSRLLIVSLVSAEVEALIPSISECDYLWR